MALTLDIKSKCSSKKQPFTLLASQLPKAKAPVLHRAKSKLQIGISLGHSTSAELALGQDHHLKAYRPNGDHICRRRMSSNYRAPCWASFSSQQKLGN